jgi:hypothetical protein
MNRGWPPQVQLMWAVVRRLVPRPPEIAAGVLFIGAVAAALTGSSLAIDTIGLSVLIGALVAAPIVVEEWLERLRRLPEPGPVVSLDAADSSAEAAPARPSLTGMSDFRGRQAELEWLMELHTEQRRLRNETPTDNRPVVLTIHGMPGVGKSELAKELAVRLAPQYPDGCVLVRFNQAATPRPPAEIIKEFLRELGWPKEMPSDADAAGTLLSFTNGKKIIFVFDAGRNVDQVKAVMPTEPGCAVFITSRQDLSGGLPVQPAWATGLDVPSAEDAVQMLAAYGNIDWLADAETATDVVELCGRLPVAIRSVAERMARDGTPLRNVATRLGPRASRLKNLSQPGRSVIEGVETEFERLNPTEQDALCLLSLIDSRTFIPWVLQPLLGVGEAKAESTMAELGRAQLLQPAGPDHPTGLPRYEFNPLVRLFAEDQLASRRRTREGWAEQAQAELDRSYVEFASAVLIGIGDGYAAQREWTWVRRPGPLHTRVASSPQRSLRLEYRNLVRTVRAVGDENDHETCWRMAARLEGSVPEDLDLDGSLKAFESGVEAARAVGNTVGVVDVRLSRAYLYVALEEYATVLTELDEIADEMRQEFGDAAAGQRRLAGVHRIRAMAYLQIGWYSRARSELAGAAELTSAVPPDERQLTALLQAECDRVPYAESGGPDTVGDQVADSVYFRARLNDAEAARVGGRWEESRAALLVALHHSAGDLRRSADVYYRLGRLCIDRRLAAGEPRSVDSGRKDSPHRLARQAVSYAAQAVVAFRHMGNWVGVIRAQCLQIRALVAAGKLVEAEQLCVAVAWDLKHHVAKNSPARASLRARFLRARGERRLQDDGTVELGRQDLKASAMIFAELEDWYSQDEVWRLLRK